MKENMESTDMLVISAHPDDAEFGVAGTVADWTRAGKKVVYVVCTRGEKGTTDRHLTPNPSSPKFFVKSRGSWV